MKAKRKFKPNWLNIATIAFVIPFCVAVWFVVITKLFLVGVAAIAGMLTVLWLIEKKNPRYETLEWVEDIVQRGLPGATYTIEYRNDEYTSTIEYDGDTDSPRMYVITATANDKVDALYHAYHLTLDEIREDEIERANDD